MDEKPQHIRIFGCLEQLYNENFSNEGFDNIQPEAKGKMRDEATAGSCWSYES